MKMHSVLTTLAASLAASLLGCSAASAQVGGMGPSPLGAATPLAIGPGQPVAPTGIPLDATEMTSPGISPALPSTASTMGRANTGGPTSQAATALFDGGGMAPMARRPPPAADSPSRARR
jgi:hypothetical protein